MTKREHFKMPGQDILIAQEIALRSNNEIIQLKKLLHSKNSHQWNSQPAGGVRGNVCCYTSDREFISRVYKGREFISFRVNKEL